MVNATLPAFWAAFTCGARWLDRWWARGWWRKRWEIEEWSNKWSATWMDACCCIGNDNIPGPWWASVFCNLFSFSLFPLFFFASSSRLFFAFFALRSFQSQHTLLFFACKSNNHSLKRNNTFPLRCKPWLYGYFGSDKQNAHQHYFYSPAMVTTEYRKMTKWQDIKKCSIQHTITIIIIVIIIIEEEWNWIVLHPATGLRRCKIPRSSPVCLVVAIQQYVHTQFNGEVYEHTHIYTQAHTHIHTSSHRQPGKGKKNVDERNRKEKLNRKSSFNNRSISKIIFVRPLCTLVINYFSFKV